MISMISDDEIRYSNNQDKTLVFSYSRTLDYYIGLEIDEINTENKFNFIVTKEEAIYPIIDGLFNKTKNLTANLNKGEKRLYFSPFNNGVICNNTFDKEELYDEFNNQIVWSSEAGSGPNKETILFIKTYDDKYEFVFYNEEIEKINAYYPKYVCICNSGSKSQIFPFLFWNTFQELKDLTSIKKVKKLVKKANDNL